jgi:ABC-type transport system involved in multi-copper enzyme maturation permease subunit
MIGTIARKEIVANLLSYKFFIVILLATVLLFTSFFVLYLDFKERLADYALIRPKPGEPIAVVEPNPLSIFAKGLDEAMGRSFEVSLIGINTRSGQKSGNPIFAFFPTPDFVYIVKVVLSLVALLFGFDQVCREKESGMLRLMLSNPVSRATILAGKWIGNYLSLAVPFLLVTLLGFTLINLDPAIHFTGSSLGRLGLILLAALLYLALFLSLGILVSAMTSRAATALIVLLLVWAGMVFVLPNLGTLLARQLVEVPSVKALAEKRQQIWTRDRLLAIMAGRAQQGRDAAEIHRRSFRATNEEFDRMEADYRVHFERMVRLSKAINRISPAAGFVYAATELAGTGIDEEIRLKEAVIRYKNIVLPELLRELSPGTAAPAAFTYRYRSIGQVMSGGGFIDLAILTVFGLLFLAAGFVAFLRYDVR